MLNNGYGILIFTGGSLPQLSVGIITRYVIYL